MTTPSGKTQYSIRWSRSFRTMITIEGEINLFVSLHQKLNRHIRETVRLAFKLIMILFKTVKTVYIDIDDHFTPELIRGIHPEDQRQ